MADKRGTRPETGVIDEIKVMAPRWYIIRTDTGELAEGRSFRSRADAIRFAERWYWAVPIGFEER